MHTKYWYQIRIINCYNCYKCYNATKLTNRKVFNACIILYVIGCSAFSIRFPSYAIVSATNTIARTQPAYRKHVPFQLRFSKRKHREHLSTKQTIRLEKEIKSSARSCSWKLIVYRRGMPGLNSTRRRRKNAQWKVAKGQGMGNWHRNLSQQAVTWESWGGMDNLVVA